MMIKTDKTLWSPEVSIFWHSVTGWLVPDFSRHRGGLTSRVGMSSHWTLRPLKMRRRTRDTQWRSSISQQNADLNRQQRKSRIYKDL